MTSVTSFSFKNKSSTAERGKPPTTQGLIVPLVGASPFPSVSSTASAKPRVSLFGFLHASGGATSGSVLFGSGPQRILKSASVSQPQQHYHSTTPNPQASGMPSMLATTSKEEDSTVPVVTTNPSEQNHITQRKAEEFLALSHRRKTSSTHDHGSPTQHIDDNISYDSNKLQAIVSSKCIDGCNTSTSATTNNNAAAMKTLTRPLVPVDPEAGNVEIQEKEMLHALATLDAYFESLCANQQSLLEDDFSSQADATAWKIETLEMMMDELFKGVEYPSTKVSVAALSALGRFVFLYGRSLDGITDRRRRDTTESFSMAATLAERIVPVLLRMLAENPTPSNAEPQQQQQEVPSISASAMVVLEMIMARLNCHLLLPLFLNHCLGNIDALLQSGPSVVSESKTTTTLVTAQFCVECIIQLLPYAGSFFSLPPLSSVTGI